jgi:four helix bundle protein
MRIIAVYSSLPNSIPAQTLGRQLIRSGTSVGAHYREAMRARSTAEFKSKLEVGLQELEETGYWLELLSDSDIVATSRLVDLFKELNELSAIFASSVRTAKSRK